MYEPALGRFLQRDPVPAMNPFEYVSGRPTVEVDPFGLVEFALPGAQNSAVPQWQQSWNIVNQLDSLLSQTYGIEGGMVGPPTPNESQRQQQLRDAQLHYSLRSSWERMFEGSTPIPQPKNRPFMSVPWAENYGKNPTARKDFDELVDIVANLTHDVPWKDPCFEWASKVNIPVRFSPGYTGADRSTVTVRPVYWDVDFSRTASEHVAFEVTFPDGTKLYFDEGGDWSTWAGALGGSDRWFKPREIPFNYYNQRYKL
jgi:hypothetical protein